MQIKFESILHELEQTPRTWLVTGCAGFIGSNITEFLLKHNQKVRGLDSLEEKGSNNL
jgi:UDP-N-acetylglucosamine 4-epimerase